jgi:hypothetical protein
VKDPDLGMIAGDKAVCGLPGSGVVIDENIIDRGRTAAPGRGHLAPSYGWVAKSVLSHAPFYP